MPLGIISALDLEIAYLREQMAEPIRLEKLRTTFVSGDLAGHQVVLTTSGIGKVKAAAITQFLIDQFGAERLIFTGIAGALNPELRLGDLIISRRTVQHDFDRSLTAVFERWAAPDLDLPDDTDVSGLMRSRWYDADPVLIDAAWQAAQALGRAERTRQGVVLTGDQVVASTTRKEWLYRRFGGDCVEMEGAAVAVVCGLNQVPFVLIRAISDFAGESAAAEALANRERVAAESASLVLQMLRRL